jgi:benzylsuccinate CoA-transferase BbsF subunit
MHASLRCSDLDVAYGLLDGGDAGSAYSGEGPEGAEVIKVETKSALDEMTFIPPWSRGAGQPDYQSGKRRITLDVRTEVGRGIFLRLVALSDVVMTNFRNETLEKWGIGFGTLRATNRLAIVMWQTGLGGAGPYHNYKCYGNLVQHMAAVSTLGRYAGEDAPVAVNTSYSDYHCGVFQAFAIIAALTDRGKTGKGATLECSILASGAVTVGPRLLLAQVGQADQPTVENENTDFGPHGVYRCRGEDRYCAISVWSDSQWSSLCDVL